MKPRPTAIVYSCIESFVVLKSWSKYSTTFVVTLEAMPIFLERPIFEV
jgi:hypothetical protein